MFRPYLASITLLALSQTALAQQAPLGAGGQLQQIPPAPAPDKRSPDIIQVDRPERVVHPEVAGPTIRVTTLHVTGNRSFREATLIAAAQLTPGSDVALSQLRDAAARITAFYNSRGYILAQAYVPAQNIVGGNITIEVVEGRLGKTEIRDSGNLAGRVPRAMLGGLESGAPVEAGSLERRLLLLSDIPGVRVKSTLTPGTAVGTSDLIVDITSGRLVSGSIEADNAGNRFTGAHRLGGTINLNNPTGIGDLANLRILGSWDGLAYGRATYQAPIGRATIGAAFTHLRYELGREFSELKADGTANIFSLYGSYPLVRSRSLNLNAQAGMDARYLRDRVGAVDSESDKNVRAGILGLSGESRDRLLGGGSNAFSVGLTLGKLNIEGPAEREADALTARSQGGYGKLQFAATRLQALSGPLSLYASVRGQLAFDNLDSSEKMALGGAYGVRAYPEGDAYGDEGYVATLEGRLMLSQWTGDLPGHFQLIGFADVGQVRYANDPWVTGSNRATRSGIGAGLGWAGARGFGLKASYATRLGSAQSTSGSDKSGQFWFQVSRVF